ncbi:phage tail sheath subtilisin-like domain-containing protein [Cellulosilyticum sp. I15G10I2]|uniref:phage tail sheath subtilisin-like domain-containing protein n=1 Tax=Cellulosilyticum sp. I15G10I2 TaxID=1892843 RepID=UPI00085C992A|nr:phage tail sheath subtilisin-like domain-containing protein [Cellulosilyticum sp. I15G10I2]
MSGTWTSQNKVLPGVYINFLTNKPLSIMPGDRGTVALAVELSVGEKGDLYYETATSSELKEKAPTAADYELVTEALKCAQSVIVYNLGVSHTIEDLDACLNVFKTEDFNVFAYPFDGDNFAANKATVTSWVKALRADEGKYVQAVLANYKADDEAIINVVNGVKLSDNKILSAAQCTAWVAGATAGARINQSNTNKKYIGAIDAAPKMTKTQMEAAVNAGEFIFKSDFNQNVTAVYDINSFTTFTADKAKDFRKNRVVRIIDNVNNDVTSIFEASYMGKVNNNDEGRSLLRASLIDYFKELQRLQAIQNFTPEDVTVLAGADTDAVIINSYIQPVDSAEKFYITVNLK